MSEISKKKLTVKKDKPEIYQIPRFIGVDEVLRLTNKGWYIGKRKIQPEEVASLKAEARDFKQSYLWSLMRKDVHYLAYLQATAKRSTDLDAIYAGAMYRDLEILEEFLDKLETL